jgi:integrase/recombinase XerC
MTDRDTLIARYEKHLRGIGRPKTTIELRRHQLRYLAKSLNTPAQLITEADLIDWMARHDWKPETRRSYRAGVRGFFAWAHKTGAVGADPAVELPGIKPDWPVPRPAPDVVWSRATMAADRRVGLMLRLAGEAGLRRGEVAAVHTRDLRAGEHGPQLLVHGKGRRERLVPITEELAAGIAAGAAGHTPGESADGWLFPGPIGHLSAKYVGQLCAQVMPDVWTMHALRHRFATRAYRGSRNIRAVQKLLGHSSVAMTERYTAVDDDEMRAAMMAAVA